MVDNIRMHDLDCLIVIGGTNTILTGYKLTQKGVNVIAIPKAIENDILEQKAHLVLTVLSILLQRL